MVRSPKASPGPQEVAALQALNQKPNRELSCRHRDQLLSLERAVGGPDSLQSRLRTLGDRARIKGGQDVRLPPCSPVKGAAQRLGELSPCVCQGDAACVITLQPA